MVYNVIVGFIFILFCYCIVKEQWPEALKTNKLKLFFAFSFYWAIGGFTFTPFLMNYSEFLGSIVFYFWVSSLFMIVGINLAKLKEKYQ